jgi:alkylhydroperoxidase family enzyme
MVAMTPCYRHRRSVWIAGCADCTAWHLAAARLRQDEILTGLPRLPLTRFGKGGRAA